MQGKNMDIDSKQAEALSDALDALNRGRLPEKDLDNELMELIHTAALVKGATQASDLPPPAILEHIVNQTANTIGREKKKRRLAWGFAGLSGAVAAVMLFTLLHVMPPTGNEQELAKTPQSEPPIAEAQPPQISSTPAGLEPPVAAKGQAPVAPAKEQITPAKQQTRQIDVALQPPTTPIPAASDQMLALADRKADAVTIDAVNKVIRQVYRQGAPDEIIITQAPKRQAALRSAPPPPRAETKMAAPIQNEAQDIKPPNRNKVTVTVDDEEVTIEGAASEEQLLNMAKSLTKVSVSK